MNGTIQKAGPTTGTYDFDLHGIVRVRLVDATPKDRATVVRQLGPLSTTGSGEPDIVVRFVDRLPDDPLRYVGLRDCGFNEHGFFVLKGTGRACAKALVAFDQVGNRPGVTCERALPAVPHLIALINLTALSKGVLPLHASAYTLGPRGVLVTGWAKGGKTESLLAAMDQGGCYVGDEWVYLTPQQEMLGLPEPIRLWAWQLEQLPGLLSNRTRHERARLVAWRSGGAALTAWGDSALPGSDVARRTAPVVSRQAYVQVPPAELFGRDRMVARAPLDAVVLVMSHSSPEITVTSTRPGEVAARMAASLADERAPFLAHYRQFRFAFPDRRNELVETAVAQEARLLRRLFDGRRAAMVAHPHPCSIADLGHAVHRAAAAQDRRASRVEASAS